MQCLICYSELDLTFEHRCLFIFG